MSGKRSLRIEWRAYPRTGVSKGTPGRPTKLTVAMLHERTESTKARLPEATKQEIRRAIARETGVSVSTVRRREKEAEPLSRKK